ncbi:MAG TPA: caspase family protein [Myxococcaceae bacterium]|nr:caspase family protein [Myxococcaceae bacterium]
MNVRWCVVAAVTLAACASSSGLKGAPLSAFAPEGITDQPPQRHALLVGVDQFEDGRFQALHYAGADARALGLALGEFDDVRALVRPEETRRAAILEALEALEKRIRTPRDTVLLYFSTHGSLVQRPGGDLERVLVVGDTRLDLLRETGISVDELIHRAEKLPSRRVAIVLATCHSGRGKSRILDSLAQALASRKATPPRLEDVSEAVVVLSAAAFGEAAREDATLGHDVYTHFLLEGLRAGDRDQDGAVTISEAHDYARGRTWQFTEGQQRPTAESTILGVDPIVLRGRRERMGLPVIFSYAHSSDGIAVRLSGQEKGVLPGGFAADTGTQRLELLDSGTGGLLYAGDVQLNPGDRLELHRLIPPPARLELHLEAGVFMPLSNDAREGLPVAPVVGIRVRGRNWPVPHLTSEIDVSIIGNSGTTATFDSTLPYKLFGVHLQGGMGWTFELGGGAFIEPQLRLGYLWLWRRFSGAAADESLGALTLSPALELGLSPSDAFRLGLRFETSLFSARIEGAKALQVVAQISLLVGYSF